MTKNTEPPKNDIQGRIAFLAARRDTDGFELCSLLFTTRTDVLWSYWDYDSWSEYTRTLPFSQGTATTFAEIGRWLSEVVGDNKARRKKLYAVGFQKARALARIADKNDIDAWIDYAATESWFELCEAVRREERVHGLRAVKAVRGYWMDDNQHSNIERAIEHELIGLRKIAKKEGTPAPTKSDALEVICLRTMKWRGKKRA